MNKDVHMVNWTVHQVKAPRKELPAMRLIYQRLWIHSMHLRKREAAEATASDLVEVVRLARLLHLEGQVLGGALLIRRSGRGIPCCRSACQMRRDPGFNYFQDL
jgi:hypothetical protein